MARLGFSGRGAVHAPELTRNALLFAYVTGADVLRLPLRLTADEKVVVFEDGTAERLIGNATPIEQLTLGQLRALDIGSRFATTDGSPFRYRARAESLGLLLDLLPPDVWLLLELKAEPDPRRADALAQYSAAAIVHRGRDGRTIAYGRDPKVLRTFRQQTRSRIGLATPDRPPLDQIKAALDESADLVVLTAEATMDGMKPTQAFQMAKASYERKALPLGVFVDSSRDFPTVLWDALDQEPCVWGLGTAFPLAAIEHIRPGWLWIEETWPQRAAEGGDVNTDLWHLGYAKFNPDGYCHVHVDQGIHVDIRPYDKPIAYTSTGDALRDELQLLRERTWDALKDWPFYSGGGIGFVPGIVGDFSAEVDIASATASQATTVEMAAVNVDPAAHRPPWRRDPLGNLIPNLPTSFRDRHTFFDPHGAPPFLGVEHDEDDGWRINWNLGNDYESNQYGHPAGDGRLLTGRIRLDRRGPFFAAAYRPSGKSGTQDWICVGTTRNDSLHERVFLRLAGKRWRQENPERPSEWMPVIANRFTFLNMTIRRSVRAPGEDHNDG